MKEEIRLNKAINGFTAKRNAGTMYIYHFYSRLKWILINKPKN